MEDDTVSGRQAAAKSGRANGHKPFAEEDPSASFRRLRPKGDGISLFFWFLGALVGALASWSMAGQELVGAQTQHLVETIGIFSAGGVGLFLGVYLRRRNVHIERTYSGHLEELSQRLRNLLLG